MTSEQAALPDRDRRVCGTAILAAQRLAPHRDVTWPRRCALLLVTALAGLSYAWALGRDPLEPYYLAAVRSMSVSWHNFIFGAFDPAGTVTLDKLPGAFWVQALAVRAFGVHTWVIVAPQAIEGVLTVLVLYRAVQRLAGPAAGLIAAAVVAVSPATVALNRGNISDSLMILLLVLAADAVCGAVARGSGRKLILAAVWVGLAFQAKMIEAWLVMPALGLAYLVSAPGPALRRVRQLAVAGVVAALVSVSWMTAVSLVPAAHRPYADGSHDNSVYEQVFIYNGFGRFGDQTPLQLLAGQSLGVGSVLRTPAAGPARLLHGDLGLDTGWLLPAALLIAGWGIVSRRRRPRGDLLRSCFVLWGGWLATLAVVFSLTTTINAYYTAALTPAIAALVGAGVMAAWSQRQPAGERQPGPAGRVGLAVGPAVVLAVTVGYAGWLVAAAGGRAPGWLLPAVIAVGIAALAVAAVSVAAVSAAAAAAPGRLRSAAVRSDRLLAAALAGGLIAVSLAPAAASAELVTQHEGAFDTPFESARAANAIDALFLRTPARVQLTIPQLENGQNGAPDLLATQTAALASVFIDDSGLEALPIGGFTGTIPSPTLRQLQADIRAGQFHLVLAASSSDPRLQWIAAHCLNLPHTAAALHAYYCQPADAG